MKFDPPIQFPVRVSGTRIIANIEEQIGSTDQFVLTIRFSDGFKDTFYLSGDGNIYGTSEKAGPYELSLKKDISILIGLEKERYFFLLEELIESTITNVWIFNRSTSPSSIVYAIYYNNVYRFELKHSSNSWIAFTKSRINPVINQTVRKRVEELLNRELGFNN